MPVELLPHMMRSIRTYSAYHIGSKDISRGFDDVEPLSLVYEICRHWDESLAIYEVVNSGRKSTGLVAGDMS